jgi:hypothetical protein
MESFEDKMTEKVFNLGKDIIMKDQRAKIFVGGDLNRLLNRMKTFNAIAGFTPSSQGIAKNSQRL